MRLPEAPPLRSEAAAANDLRDDALIRRYVENAEEAAFVLLIRRYLPQLRRVLFGILNGNREDMQDVEQEVLVALCRELPRYRFGSAFSTYLYRFARNKGIDFLRKQARHKRIVQAEALRLSLEPPRTEPAPIFDHREELQALLARLSPSERLLIVLKDVEGRKLAEIAEITGLPEGTIKSRLHRTRGKIMKMIERSRL